MPQAVNQQNAIDVDVTDGGVITIKQDSLEFGKDVEILVQPEHAQQLIDAIRLQWLEIGAKEIIEAAE